MNETIESLFPRFLEATPAGELAEEVRRISKEIDALIEAGGCGAPLQELVGDYELAATRNGFYAGFIAAMNLQMHRAIILS